MANALFLVARQTRPDRLADRTGQTVDVHKAWSRSLEIYDAVVATMEQVTIKLSQSVAIDDAHSAVRQALLSLNAAGTMVAREIGCLLELGYLSGGASRWRALHEISVTADVIANCHPIVAERYLDHGFVVGTRRLARFWNQPHPDAPPADVRDEQLAEAARLCLFHEPADPEKFARDYGWAIPVLKEIKGDKRSRSALRDLEELASSGHRRLLVEASANSFVHADSAGVRAAVVNSEPGSPIGSRHDQLHTIGVPALDSLRRLAAAVTLGFETEFNEDGKYLIEVAIGIRSLATRGIKIFKADGKKARERATSDSVSGAVAGRTQQGAERGDAVS